jgi:hypothetical protein
MTSSEAKQKIAIIEVGVNCDNPSLRSVGENILSLTPNATLVRINRNRAANSFQRHSVLADMKERGQFIPLKTGQPEMLFLKLALQVHRKAGR